MKKTKESSKQLRLERRIFRGYIRRIMREAYKLTSRRRYIDSKDFCEHLAAEVDIAYEMWKDKAEKKGLTNFEG